MAKLVNNKFGMVPEKLSTASPARQACAECALHEGCDEPFLTPYVPRDWTGEFLFVVEVSKDGESAVGRGIYLGERERHALGRALDAAKVSKDAVAFLPVLRCRPVLVGSRKPKMHSLRACRPFLVRAIGELNPTHVLAFGDTAVKAVTNSGAVQPIAKLRGRELVLAHTGPVIKDRVFATVRLSSLVSDPHATQRLIEDLVRMKTKATPYPKVGMPTGKEIALDTEYTGATVHTIAVADEHTALSASPRNAGPLLNTIKNAVLVGHNLPVDIEALLNSCKIPVALKGAFENWLQGRRQRDTGLEAKLADENRGKHGYKLESLTTSFYNIKDWKAPTEAIGIDSSLWPPALRDERCRLDAWATLLIHKKLEDSTQGPSQLSHAIAMSLRRMYHTGVYIDAAKFRRMGTVVDKARAEALVTLTKFAKKFKIPEFSATKDDCIRQYVYGKGGVGLAVESLTKGGLPSVSVKVLKEYKDDQAIAALLTFSKYDKLQSTYCASLGEKFQKVSDGVFLPVQINPLAAKTGRRSSNAPNLQNWPVAVRQIIVSRFKGGSIADNDYSKLEPIIGGWVTNEPRLTEYFVKYPNGYIKIGEDFFKKKVEKTSDQYRAVKALVLAIIYNKKRWSLAEDLWVNHGVKLDSNYEKHEDKAGEILDKFLNELFPGVKKYHARQKEAVLRDGYVTNALGQYRRLPLPEEPQRSEKGAYKIYMRYKSHVENQAINYPIQSLAAYVTGCGLVDLERAFLAQYGWSYTDYQLALMEKKWPRMPLLCIEVHDDLVEDIPKGMEKKAKEITHDVMCKPPSLLAALPELFDSNVRLSVDTNVGPCWGLKS